MRKSRVFLAFLLAFLAINGVSYASDTIPLSCAKKTTYVIRISNVIKGCEKTEYSLGAGAIPRSLIRPSAIDKQLMYRFKAAQAAAKKDGQVLYIASGFRTLSRQKTLFAQAVKKIWKCRGSQQMGGAATCLTSSLGSCDRCELSR